MFDCKLGTVVKIRGFKGEIVVETRFKNTEMFRTVTKYKIDDTVYKTVDFKNLGNRAGLLLNGITTDVMAKKFIGKTVFYSKDEVNYGDKLFLEDMLDFMLVDEDGKSYGILDSIENYGAGDLLVVINNDKEIYLPERKGFITGYDKEKHVIFVDKKLIGEVLYEDWYPYPFPGNVCPT